MVKMYHYTRRANLESIQKTGIQLGINPLRGAPVVSMTTNKCPKRLGLQTGAVLVEGIDADFEPASKAYPDFVFSTESGAREVRMFDQTEVRLEITVPDEAKKHILNYDQLFNRDAPALLPNGSLKKFSKKQIKFFWAIAVHSADYPFATDHVPNEVVDREIGEIASGKKTHRALEWRFSTVVIPPSYISKIEHRQEDGHYSE
ncbi:TPA: hypothetical protein ACVOYQ_004592 [Vibrio alginolyticus]|uniref:hypothetical protein n=1 Tax=Vibrio sp. zbq_19 TaxID=3367252 RepID=UPI0021CFC335|nr:hypothetical protein [Vibrio alginolyticus]ELA7389580.1 hypothetical protein [Vibrio alginolyticus]